MSNNIELLSKYTAIIPYFFKNIPEADLLHKPKPEKWSKKEIFGHLIDSGVYNLERFTKIRFAPQPFEIVPYPQDDLVRANDYQHGEVEQMLQLWGSLNRQIRGLWEKYSAEELKLEIFIPKMNKNVDLKWWINDYMEHMEHHFKQIFGSLESLKTPHWHISLTNAKAELSKVNQKRFVTLLEHGSMYVEYYSPLGKDLQTPHRQDELYIVISGEGTFYNNGERHPFKTGDLLFAPAGMEHRFENFSKDFATWVIFYGPDGGERNRQKQLE